MWAPEKARVRYSLLILSPLMARGVGGYNHHCIGEEVEWRTPMLYANPLGHRVSATPDM